MGLAELEEGLETVSGRKEWVKGLIFVSKWQGEREQKRDGSGRVTILMITLFWFCWTWGHWQQIL